MSWFGQAQCRGMRPEVFVPTVRGGGHRKTIDDRLEKSERRAADELKPEFCDRCPVWQECLSWAVLRQEQGVWAGTTTRERRFLYRFLPLECEWCHATFHPGRTNARFCSEDCRNHAGIERRKAVRVTNGDPYPRTPDYFDRNYGRPA